MHKAAVAVLAVSMLFSCGCARFCVRSLPAEDARELLDAAGERLAGRFEVLSSVVLQYRVARVSALGVTSVDRQEGRFAAAGLNPVGMKIFELSGDRAGVEHAYVMPDIPGGDDLPSAVAESIRAVYFGLIPAETDDARIRGRYMRIRTAERAGMSYEYLFGFSARRLARKRCYRNGRLLWEVRYTGWGHDAEGRLYPLDARFIHHLYGYRVSIAGYRGGVE